MTQHYLRYEIAREPHGVELDFSGICGVSQLDDTPVVTDSALAARLPAIHDLSLCAEGIGVEGGCLGFQQVGGGSKPLVRGPDNFRANAITQHIHRGILVLTGHFCLLYFGFYRVGRIF